MLYETHLEKLVHRCVDFPLDFLVPRVVSLLDWFVILHFDLVIVLKSASSASRNAVVSSNSFTCCKTSTNIFSSSLSVPGW